LDLDWDSPTAREQALAQVLAVLDAVEQTLAAQPLVAEAPALAASLRAAHEVVAQDVERAPDGSPRLRDGVARDRRIALEDAEMRHGRKSRSEKVDGYKRHACRDLDTDLVRAVGVTAANVPEATVTPALATDLARQAVVLRELHIDRGYLSSHLVRERSADLTIYCKAWPVAAGPPFPKTAFMVDWEAGTLRCPNGVTIPCVVGATVRFPAATCAACPQRADCTTSPQGRSVTLHPDERLLRELRARQQTVAGRAQLRERVAIEHTLAHLGRWQGWRARYRGLRKNLFDLRRVAVIHNLHVLQRPRTPHRRSVA
jgi:transposase